MQKGVNKQLMNLKRGVLLFLLANAMAIALIYVPDFPNKIDEIATFLTLAVIIGMIYSYFIEKNKIINHKAIYIDKNTKKIFFIISIIAGIIIMLTTFITKSIVISGILAIIFFIVIFTYFYNKQSHIINP